MIEAEGQKVGGEHASLFLRSLPRAAAAELLRTAVRISLPPGSVFYRPGDPAIVDVVLDGLVRAYYALPDGRETTFGFVHAGGVCGLTTIWDQEAPPLFAAAVLPTRLLSLDPGSVRQLAAEDPEVAGAIALYLSRALVHATRLVSVRTLGTIRERLAWDLLERARWDGQGVNVTHADLASSLGTSREVVTREMGLLRAAGLVTTQPGHIEIGDKERLAAVVAGFTD